MVTETGVLDLIKKSVSGNILHVGCLVLLTLVSAVLMTLPLLFMLLDFRVYMKHAQTTEGTVTGFESVPVLRTGPDGEDYTAYDQHAVVSFRTADGTERTFTNEFRVPIRSTLKKGDSVTVRYNDTRAMLIEDYERNMTDFRKKLRTCLLLTAGYVLIAALIVIRGKQRKQKKNAADASAG